MSGRPYLSETLGSRVIDAAEEDTHTLLRFSNGQSVRVKDELAYNFPHQEDLEALVLSKASLQDVCVSRQFTPNGLEYEQLEMVFGQGRSLFWRQFVTASKELSWELEGGPSVVHKLRSLAQEIDSELDCSDL